MEGGLNTTNRVGVLLHPYPFLLEQKMIKPLKFQKASIQKACRDFKCRSLLAFDMGLGKTLTSLWCIREYPLARPLVIVCPAIMKFYWQQEAAKVLGVEPIILNGTKPHLVDSDIVVINYDILQYWVDKLRLIRPKAVILDECQAYKNLRSKRTRAVKRLCKGVRKLLALSGTPLQNRPIELWPIVNMLRPSEFPSRRSFGRKYCGPKWTPWGWQFTGATNTEELHEKLVSTCMIRVRTEDVVKDLPEKNRQVIPVEMRRPQEYKRASEDFLHWLMEKNPDKLKTALRAEALVRMTTLLKLAAKLKLKSVVEWVNTFLTDSDEKLVVFAKHHKMIEALTRRCKAESLVITGKTPQKKRSDFVSRFQNDNKARLLIGNVRAAGIGITLTAANHEAIVELDWEPAVLLQAEKRIHRLGTRRPCWFHYLIAYGTIEEKLCKAIQKKQQIITAVLDGEQMSGEDFDLFDMLIDELKS